MIDHTAATRAESIVANLEAWLETMRCPDGYGGPVAHWWRDCLLFCGSGLDWRYEGIIAGYLTLFQRTGQAAWLERAKAAGNDLAQGQMASGCFRDSRFELNPGSAGTPHEAAADVGLLLLAKALRRLNDPAWKGYLAVAQQNLEHFYLHCLWCAEEQRFRDEPGRPSFVPNKTATLIEALCLLVELSGDDGYLSRYVRAAADAILAHQIQTPCSRLRGAIAQNTLGHTLIEKYFPYYIARCVPGLLAAGIALAEDRYVAAAADAIEFVWRCRDEDGGFPQVIYGDGRVNRQPRWVAGVADILRAADVLRPYGLELPTEPSLTWLLSGQLPSGAFATGRGFADQALPAAPSKPPDFRDLLPVCGWNDKSFRYLTTRIDNALPAIVHREPWSARCAFKGAAYTLAEDDHRIVLSRPGDRPVYTWVKGARWARVGTEPSVVR